MMTRRFKRSKLLQMTNIPDNLLDHFIRMGLVPHPSKILWLNPASDEEYFPDYVLFDLWHVNFLQRRGIRAPWELRELVLGSEGIVKYEREIKQLCGDSFYEEVNSNEGEVDERLCKAAERHLPSYRIAAATFRAEKMGGKSFLILSQVVLKPKQGFFQVQIRQPHLKENTKKISEVYRIILRGTLS